VQQLDVGEKAPILTNWWDDDGNAAEPTAIVLTITKPDGTTIVKAKADMTGSESVSGSGVDDVWTYEQLVDADGIWRVHAEGTVGTSTVIQSFLFLAGASEFGVGPCEPWAEWSQVEGQCPTVDFSSIGPEQRADLLDVATGILWSLDGRRYPGICTTTRRVCRSCSSCVTALCCCSPRGAVDLGTRWPAWGVLEVVVDGVTLDPSAYGLRDHRWLDRLDGDSWPACASLTDPDAFTVTWAYGRRPPIELSDAVAVFTAEMAKSCLGLKCDLPQRVTSIVRENVTYTILDSQRFIDDGRTGVYRVDLALKAAREGRKASPGMRSPLVTRRFSRSTP